VAGIYIHIPFCKQRCTYCDFHFSTNFERYRNELIAAIVREIKLRKIEVRSEIQTIYFGGGTPSLLRKNELSEILTAVRANYVIAENVEITLEANPEDINESNLNLWKNEGVNRLSIGLQSFKENDMLWMNRAHKANDGEIAVRLAQSCGFDNITVDLIYGLPHLSNNEWLKHLERVVQLNINHISSYCLTVEPKTALHHQVKHRQIVPPNEETQSEQFEIMVNYLKTQGFEQYEISNFARNNHYSKHNSSYWKGIHYLGIGPSAHSFDGEKRRWNIANNTVYYKNVGVNQSWFSEEILSEKEKWNELFLTGFRTKWGVIKTTLENLSSFTDDEKKQLNQYISDGDIVETDSSYLLSEKGKIRADGIASSFFRI